MRREVRVMSRIEALKDLTLDDAEEIVVKAVEDTNKSEAGFVLLFASIFVLFLLISILLSKL